MQKILTGFLIALAVVGLAFLGRRARANEALTQASATYLFSETDIKGKDGKPLSRADLLDAILRDAVVRASQPK